MVGQLIFSLNQDSDFKYDGYSFIKLGMKGGYSYCDEYGQTFYLGGPRSNDYGLFLIPDEETKLAFLGEVVKETIEIDGKEKVTYLAKICEKRELESELKELYEWRIRKEENN